MSKLLKTLVLVVFVMLVIALSAPTPITLVAGGTLVVLGELIRLWASGHLLRNNEVTTSGPYSYVRDPLYLGRLLLILGFCIMAWGYSLLLLIPGLAVFFFNYMPRKFEKEMKGLEKLFGEEYRTYAAYTHSLLPKLRPFPHARRRNWSFDLLWNENREQYFLLGVLIIAAALILKGQVIR